MKKRTLNEYRQTKEYYTHKKVENKAKFVEDLIQSRIEGSINAVTEDARDDLFELIHEAMLDFGLIDFEKDGIDITEDVNNNFHKIYIGVLLELIKEQLK